MDDTFGGVIIARPETQVTVQISQSHTFSGFSGYSGPAGPAGSGGGGGGSGFSSFSGFSGRSGDSGHSGFSGFSSRSGFSGYSGAATSGFSGFSGASGISGASGPGGGNSGFSGFSGLDGTFSASGFSGFSGFSSRSGFSGFSGSGVSGYSGFSGLAASGFSGFSGPGSSGFSGYSSFSGFSGFSGRSGFSGGPSGFSGFSGTGSPSGGSAGDFQYNDGAGGFAGTSNVNFSGGAVQVKAPNVFFNDTTDPTKKVRIDVGNLSSGTTAILSIPGVNNPTAVAPSSPTANQFVTGIGTAGVVTKAQVDFGNLSGLATYGQMDRTTAVVAETATLTIAANTKIKSTASGTLTTIVFSGVPNAAQARRLDLDITGGPYTLTIPACRRIGETGTITSLQVFAGYNEFQWEFINGEYVMSDSVTSSGGGGAGSSGFSGFAGAGVSGFSAYSGFSGATGAQGISGFSGSGGGGGGTSGFSGFSAPSLMPFNTRTDTDYTLAIGDTNTGVKMVSAAAHILTVPANATVAFPIGTQVAVEQGGTGVVTITAAGGVTLQGASATSGQYSVVVLIKQATDTWLVAKSGASGYSGYSGGVGGSGFSGFSGGGPSGFSGFSGAGLSGFSGFSSTSGFSGFSGRSGYSGFSGPSLFLFNTKIDQDYTLLIGDANTGIKMQSSSAHTLTVPTNATAAFAIGTQIAIEQGGSGVVTIVPAGGVTLEGALNTAGQYSVLVLIKQATDQWFVASGNSGYSGYSGYSGRSGFSGFSAFSGFSGSGGLDRVFVSGASDVATTGQALVDITGLVTPTLLNATLYSIKAILYVSSTTSSGTQYGIHCDGSGTVGTCNAIVTGTLLTNTTSSQTISAIDTPTTSYLTVNNINGTIVIHGWVMTRSTGTATISLQHLKVVSGTSTVKSGSFLEYRVAF